MRPTSLGRAGRRLPAADLAEALPELSGLDLKTLRSEWQRLHSAPAPSCFSQDMVVRGIAYRLQEAALGGLPTRVKQQLATSSSGEVRMGQTQAAPLPRLKPGTTLLREWHGRTHSVLVVEAGFEYQGRCYASLSHVAREITGAHWSGPRFFGLTRGGKSARARHTQGADRNA